MRLYNQTSAECTGLFTVLNGVEPLTARNHLFDEILPFELEVINARVRYWSDDHIGYLDALMILLNKCKRWARESSKMGSENGYNMWVERGTRITLIIASQLIEMKVCQTVHLTQTRSLLLIIGRSFSCTPPHSAD